jgi:hypothetical protein
MTGALAPPTLLGTSPSFKVDPGSSNKAVIESTGSLAQELSNIPTAKTADTNLNFIIDFIVLLFFELN